VSTIDYGINITNRNHITVEDLQIIQSASTGVYVHNADFITVDNCNIVNPDETGIHHEGSGTNLKAINNTISGANSRGISVENANSIISGNTISDIAIIENINKSLVAGNVGTAIYSRNNVSALPNRSWKTLG
jgi:hypothetical protein